MRDLDARCSQHFTYRELIECGKTWASLASAGFDNLPKQEATWQGLELLAERLLDPLTESLGRPTLTYAFASPALARRVPGRIAPKLDQHAGAELNRKGELLCARAGQAVDLLVPGVSSVELAEWVIERGDFDRLYFYGASSPVHISISRQSAAGAIVLMVERDGRRVPRSTTKHAFGEAVRRSSQWGLAIADRRE